MNFKLFKIAKTIGLITTIILSCGSLVAQKKETYDILTFTAPVGYKKELRNNNVVYTLTNKKDKSWCQIAIYKNTSSEGSVEKDFDAEWLEIVASGLNVKDAPQKEAISEAGGWKVLSGSAKWIFDKRDVATILTTATGYGARLSILVNTNAGRYLNDYKIFFASIEWYKPGNEEVKTTNTNSAGIAGTWVKSGGVSPVYGNTASWGAGGYTKDQYSFFDNGTYTFYSKSFGYSVTNLILARESGTYTINGNKITISPKTSVVEAWSKKNNTDKWGSLVSSQKRNLETVTYTFTKHYFSGIEQWNLVLQPPAATSRDGSFSTLTLFTNAYYYAPISGNHTGIELPQ